MKDLKETVSRKRVTGWKPTKAARKRDRYSGHNGHRYPRDAQGWGVCEKCAEMEMKAAAYDDLIAAQPHRFVRHSTIAGDWFCSGDNGNCPGNVVFVELQPVADSKVNMKPYSAWCWSHYRKVRGK